MIDCEHIIVYTFDSSLSVSTFRTVSLPKDMEKFKNDLENQYLASMMEKLKNKDKIEAQGNFLNISITQIVYKIGR